MKDDGLRQLEPSEALSRAMREMASATIPDADLRTVLGRVARSLRSLTGCEAVCCLTFGESPGQLLVQAIECDGVPPRAVGDSIDGPRSGFLRDAVERGSPVVDRSEGAECELAFPVAHGSTAVAVLHVIGPDVQRIESMLLVLEAVSDQVVCAITGARLFEDLRWQSRTMEMLHDVGRAVLEADSLPDVLRQITDFVVERFDAALVDVLLLDESKRLFDVVAYSGTVALIKPKGDEWPVTSGVCGRCARTGEPQLVADVDLDPDYHPADPAIRSEYCVPLFYRGEVIGVLNVEGKDRDAFTSRERETLRAIAEQVSGAIHMAHLNQRLVESNRVVAEKTVELEEANRKLALANRELEMLSTHDALTMVPNRRRFDQVLDNEWRRAKRSGKPLSLLFVDIDHFKALNDNYGHREGDECLRRVAHALQAGLRRAGDFIARYGGEEFALILPDTDRDQAETHANRLRSIVEELAIDNEAAPSGPILTISLGAATYRPGDKMTVDDLVRRADEALYAAKRAGRNRVVVFGTAKSDQAEES